MSVLRLPALLALLAGCAWPAAWADVAVPILQARVTDLSGTLTPPQTAVLESELAAFEQQKGSQIGILILPTTQPETIEQYGIRVGEAWKLGRKGIDDGAVLIVAKDDHRLRIEVGYGLEGALNDATSKRIIDELIVPRFRQGQFYEGIEAGVQSMLKVVSGEPLPPPKPRPQLSGGNGGGVGLIMVIFGAYIGSAILRTMFGRPLGAAFTAAGVGAAVWYFSGVLLLGLLCAVVGFVVALLGGLFGGIGPGGGGFGGGWGGGWGGGGFGGGSSGGFSGGGGSFGGGGASGSW